MTKENVAIADGAMMHTIAEINVATQERYGSDGETIKTVVTKGGL